MIMHNLDSKNINISSRKLCIDGSCIGVIGEDGRCKVCGNKYEQIHEEIGFEEVITENTKCKSCGFIVFGKDADVASREVCINCGNIVGYEQPNPLVICGRCGQQISKKARECPKCGWKELLTCPVCQQKIPYDSKSCPECGEPGPFSISANYQIPENIQDNNNQNISASNNTPYIIHESESISKKSDDHNNKKDSIFVQLFFSKSKKSVINFVISLFIAFILNIIISKLLGVPQNRNLFWTILWIYFSLEASYYWGWKALLPYPLFILATIILMVIGVASGTTHSIPYILTGIILNFFGLAIFYLLLYKRKK